jgi:hypothetical protein
MKTPIVFAHRDKGQVLVFAAIIFLLVLIPLAALFVDGSMLMLTRRQAQAAADAGALAGARVHCEKQPLDVVISTATTEYAIGKNHAATASATVNGWEVQVDTTASRPSFFAKLIGIPEITSSATATAGCLFPSNNVMPIAFNCPGGPGNGEGGCGVDMFDWKDTHTPDSVLYLLVEASGSLSNLCQPDDPSGMVCDTVTTTSGLLTPVGKTVRVLGDGAHTYVPDLCFMNVNQCLKSIIGDVQPPASTIDVLPWVDKKPGVVDVFYQTLAANVPFIYLVPFYTQDNGSQVHITMAAQFMVVCASAQPNKRECPGKTAWMDANPGYGTRTFEGYFVTNYPVDLTDPGSGGTANLGVYYVSLVK